MADEKSPVRAALAELEKRYNRLVGLSASVLCVHCGLCVESCHYVMADPGNVELSPVAKAEHARRVYKKSHDWLSRFSPRWTKAKDLGEADLDKWLDAAFRDCTLCQRCTLNCPLGVDVPAMIGAMRAALTAAGKAPASLTMLADMAAGRDKALAIMKDAFLKQIAGLEEKLRVAGADKTMSIPVEVQGARVLYVPLSGAHTIIPAAAVFNRAKESWTMSLYEAANYGVFLQDTAKAKLICDRIVNEATRLGVEEVIITECGHAYSTYRWNAPAWYPEPWPFRVRSIVEIIDEYLTSGRIKVKPIIKGKVTLHDSCNLARNGGMFEEPRRILRALGGELREMSPNRERGICCGGGGGIVATPEWKEARMRSGKPKADQIKASGAAMVAASCENCRLQLDDLNKHYGLNVAVTGITELVSQALE